jgi:integron integrase
LVDLRLRKFDPRDIEAIKSIPGRRWVPGRKVWTVPNDRTTIELLTRAFGPRLLLGPDAAGDSSSTGRIRQTRPPSSERPAPRPARSDILEALSLAVRTREYSPRTERAYLAWARRFLEFDPSFAEPGARLDPARGKAFLEHLATDARLGAKTRNQAASALGFIFREVLGQAGFEDVPRAKGPRRLPSVLSHREVLRVLRELSGDHRLVASLLYPAGLRLEECLHLRVKDIDFELRQILVRDGKGKKDRYVPLAHRTVDALRTRVLRRSELHDDDRRHGRGWAPLPGALHRKDPGAGYELGWQFVFHAHSSSQDPATGRTGRRCLHPSAVQREVKRAVRGAGVDKRASCHTLRHSFATEALRGGCDIRTLQHVLGHTDVRTTMIYLHVVEQTGFYIRSPLDRPDEPDDPLWDVEAARPSVSPPANASVISTPADDPDPTR